MNQSSPRPKDATTVGEDIQVEILRNIELVVLSRAIGPEGRIGSALILQDIMGAVKALAEHDLVETIRAYKRLKGNKE